MMAPNMCQWVMNLPMPWVWFRHKVRAVNYLHCHSEPMPGIYVSHPECCFLVAMKQNSVLRESNFFKMEVALSEDEAAVYMENGLTVCPSRELLLHPRSIWNNFVVFGQSWSCDLALFFHSHLGIRKVLALRNLLTPLYRATRPRCSSHVIHKCLHHSEYILNRRLQQWGWYHLWPFLCSQS